MELNDGVLENVRTATVDVPVIFDEEGRPKEGFKVYGANSDQYQEADRKYKQGNFRKAAQRGRPIDARTEDGSGTLVDIVAEREVVLACACVAEVYGITKAGEPLSPDDKAALRTVFIALPTWRQKVLAAVENDAGFITG